MVATAKRHSVEPFAYLKEVLTLNGVPLPLCTVMPFAYLKEVLTRLPDYLHSKRTDLLPQIGGLKVNSFSILNQDGFTEGIRIHHEIAFCFVYRCIHESIKYGDSSSERGELIKKSRREASVWYDLLSYKQMYWNKMLHLGSKIFLETFGAIYFLYFQE